MHLISADESVSPRDVLGKIQARLETQSKSERVTLGVTTVKNLVELAPFCYSLKLDSNNTWIEQLEDEIFIIDEVKKLFYHIFQASTSAEPADNLLFTHEQHKRLPDVFQRYFSQSSTGCQLEYLTSERIRKNLFATLDFFKENPTSRHIYLPIWLPEDNRALQTMVPSLIGIHIQQIRSTLLASVVIRSCDVAFFLYDVWYFLQLQKFASIYIGKKNIGYQLCMNMFNIHAYIG